MTGFFWNIRGFNKRSKHDVVKNWIHNKELKFGCLIETRVKENKAKQIVSSVFNGWSWINNYEFSRKGRIWVMWSPHTRITPVFSSSQIITVSVLLEGEEEEFFCSFVYGENLMEDRKDLWRDIKDHQNSAMFRGKPWIIMGDFNEIIDGEEHSNYQDSGLINEGMRDFEHVIQYCHFMDLGSQGPKFTWCNKRKEGLICKKLDRFLVNDIWLHKQDKSYGVFEAGGCSDHLRGRFHLQAEAIGKRRPFKFTNAVAEMSEFIKLIEDFWKSNQPLFQSTSALFRFSKSLKALKPLIKKLSKEKLGKLSMRVKEAYNDLCKHQERLMDDPNLMNIQEELTMEERWLIISAIEEKVLKQRAKLHWLQLGDGNNKVFHNAVKIREARNAIREIRCQSGEVVTTQEGIKNEAEKFFSEFLSFEPPEVQEISVEELQNFLSFRCSNEEKSKLIKPVTEEEIKEVVFKMPNNKSPGPDGYTTEFFKASWSVIGKDLVIAIQSFFSKGFLPKGLNSTILALVAKKDKAIEMRDYRPISCCNVIYKVISKIIANRLKDTLPGCISYNQSAFVKDRLLVENLLLATEIVKDYHKEDVSPRCAMKIDIAKAFDSVHWPFLLNTLRALNMPEEFVHWIELCVCTPSFSVKVNGELAGFFQSKRGLRQGCALSPYLFVICMNVLSHLLDKAAAQKVIGYHPKCQNILLTHLCFADDLLVFTDGTKRSIENVLKIFEDFAAISGLKISLEKSTLFTAGLSEAQEGTILNSFPFASGSLPVRYLGLPLLSRRMTINDYLPLVEKIRKRMSSWTGRFLSYGGRLQLINSVITSMANFWLTAFRLPGSCLKEIERLCSAFLWSGPELKTSKAKVSWEDICLPKREGGLGIRPLKEINTVLCLKLLWRLFSNKTSLWVKWIHCYLIRKSSFWSMKNNANNGSWMWRKILKLRDLAKSYIRMEVHNGNLTSFWYDS